MPNSAIVNGYPLIGLTVKEDIVKGAQATRDLLQTGIVRVFQVSGLSMYPSASVVPQALNAPGIPLMGDAHPDALFSGCIAVNQSTEVADNFDVVNVTIYYRQRSFLGSFLKSTSGALRQVPKTILGYTNSTSNVLDQSSPYSTPPSMSLIPTANASCSHVIQISYRAAGTDTWIFRPAFFNANIIESMVSFRFLEQLDPEYFNMQFPGYVNSKPWRGYPARTLQIMPIQGSSQDNFWYDNTYTFKYKSDTYDEYVFFVDPNTGQVPTDIALDAVYDGSRFYGEGWGRFQTLPMLDFNLLFSGKLPSIPPQAYGLDLLQFLGS
jgi:hypothetical protein